ncbi:DUF262 domain-containing protein [Paenibacillus sp. NPDC058174]|uniref:GmrSD restriction endonuclease domain-containing protein n=1 Tax=Paenibacillus sp. NPDC058174 TaxID=3346366 RepID=UPI0036DA0A94
MRTNIAGRLGTDTPLIKDLIGDIKKGEIKIPQFQRKFVWKEPQAFNLLDSIANNYPVGSLLLWKTQSKLTVERNIGDFKLPETDDLSPTDYVLDGQQRLTVIYSCFGANDDDQGYSIAYDLEKEEFTPNPVDQKLSVFPLRWIYQTTKLLNFRTGLASHNNALQLQERLDNLIDIVTNYRIPVVTLKDLTVEEVCPIFERINSSGTRLSTYDLMVAATWTQQFNLNNEIEEIANSLHPKGFGDIEGDAILKCMAAIKFKSVKRENVLSLRNLTKEEMDELVTSTKSSLLKSVDLLCTEFKLYSWDYLPYEAIIVILSYVFSNKKILSAEDIRDIRIWFWTSSFTLRYRGASDSFLSNDLKNVTSFIIEKQADSSLFGLRPGRNDLKKILFRSNNSSTRAYVLALACINPLNITNGSKIDTSNALSIYNKKQFHHIYPQAYLKRISSDLETNSIINICMLAASENNFISDQNPNEYLPKLIETLGERYEEVFSSNLLPLLTSTDYSKLSYEDFLELRSEIVYSHVIKLCSGEK